MSIGQADFENDCRSQPGQSTVSAPTSRPPGRFVENLSLFAFRALETLFPELGEEFKRSIECFRMSPAVPFHEAVNTLKKILNLILQYGWMDEFIYPDPRQSWIPD